MKPEQAISATVTGNDQQVGFRAMVIETRDSVAVWRQILQSTLKGDDLKKLSDKD
jgi:hypothetical protein